MALATAFTANAAITTPTNLWAVGNISGCSWDPSGIQLSKDGSKFTLEKAMFTQSPAYFHFMSTDPASGWGSGNNRYQATSNNAAVSVGTPVNVQIAGNGNSWMFTGDITKPYNLIIDCTAGTLTIEEAGAREYPDQIFVIGTVKESDGSWAGDKGAALSHSGDGQYEGTVNLLGDAAFSFTEALAPSGWNGIGLRYCPKSQNVYVTDNQEANLENGDGTYCWYANSSVGKYNFTVDLEGMTFEIERIGDAEEDAYESNGNLWVIGTVLGAEWENGSASTLPKGVTSDNKVFTFEGVEIGTAYDSQDGYFRFADYVPATSLEESAWWSSIEQNGSQFGPSGDGASADFAQANPMNYYAKSCNYSWKVAPGVYDIVVTFEGTDYSFTITEHSDIIDYTFTVEPDAGTYTEVQTVKITATPAADKIYYTLDGEDPTTDDEVYTEAGIEIEETCELRFVAYAADGKKHSEVQVKAYTINITHTFELTLTPDEGTYTTPDGTQNVKVAVEPEADVYYTTDGSTAASKEAGTQYTADGITLNEGTTVLRLKAYDEDGCESDEITKVFTVNKDNTTFIGSVAADDEATPCDVYDLTGRTVALGVAKAEVANLATGVYVVRQGANTFKVVVK